MRDYPIKSGNDGASGNDGTPFCHPQRHPFCHPQLDWGSVIDKKIINERLYHFININIFFFL